ncbi:DNA-3-methyladenine glycosylase family protein [Chloroflexota bacterium]
MYLKPSEQTDLEDTVNKLKRSDPLLAEVIDQVGPCRFKRGTQGITALVSSIIEQQLSTSSAQAIRSRVETLFGNGGIRPEQFAEINDTELQQTGLSRMKVSYLRSLADNVLNGKINFPELENMDDEAVVETLCRVKGIGRWTAQMYLMFSLGRLDVFPVTDGALRAALKHVYGLPEATFDAEAGKIADRWRPFRSIACWYLYAQLDTYRSNKKKA